VAFFPLFVDIKEKPCLIVGGGQVAYRKTKTLLQFGASIKVVSPYLCEELIKLKESGLINVEQREFADSDIENCFIAVAATSDSDVNARLSEYAAKRNIPVNVADDSGKCSFLFPSTVKRGKIIIGICSSGSFPAMTAAIREKIDEILPCEIAEITEKLEMLRKEIKSKIKQKEDKEKIMKDLAAQIIEIIVDNNEENCKCSNNIKLKKYINILNQYLEELQDSRTI